MMDQYQESLTLLLEGRREEALKKLKKAVRESPDNVDAWLTLGNLLRERGDVGKAMQIHRNLLVKKRLPKVLLARMKKALVFDYMRIEEYHRAVPVLMELIDSNPKEVSNYRLLLSAYEKLRDWQKAIKVYEKIFKLSGQSDKTDLAFYHSFVASQQLDQSLDKTDLAFYHSFVASQQLDQSLESEAEKNLKKALKLNGDCVPALIFQGDIDYAHEKIKDAKARWLRIVEKFPHLAHLVFHRLEKLYFEQGSFSEILSLYESLRRKSVKDKRVLSALVRLYEKMGRRSDAIDTLEEILAIDPADIESRAWLIQLFAEADDRDKILEQAKRLCSMYPSEFYECAHCGHRSREAFFRCPECEEWKDEVYLSCGGTSRRRKR
jgi:lipopolysaccharide biosynthesis regulator YciM